MFRTAFPEYSYFAFWGFHGIPKLFVDAVMDCEPANPSRTNAFQAKLYKKDPAFIQFIVDNAPDTVELKAYDMNEHENVSDHGDDVNEEEEEMDSRTLTPLSLPDPENQKDSETNDIVHTAESWVQTMHF